MSLSWRGAAALSVVLVSCTDPASTVGPEALTAPVAASLVSGDAGAHFLPPLGEASRGAPFDATLLPYVTMEVAPCAAAACGAPLLTMAPGRGRDAVRLAGDHYHADWSTAGLAPGRYGVIARVAGTVVASAAVELKAGRRGAASAFQVGARVPLKLSVPEGAVRVIGPAGGVVEAGPVRLDFAAGAVPGPIGVTVAAVSGLPSPPNGVLVPGTTFELGPDGTTFDAPVRLTIRYDEAALAGIPESSLRLQRRGVSSWTDVSGTVVDAAANTVSGDLGGFSPYTIVGYVPGQVLTGWGTAVTDGAISAGEWDGAAAVAIQVSVPEGGTVPATVYAMNDVDSVYFAIRYERGIPGAGEWLGVGLDDDGDGVVDAGEDGMSIQPGPDFADFHRLSCGGDFCDDVDFGGTDDGRGAFQDHGAFAVFEIAKPLASGDAFDMSVAPRDTIGFFVGLVLEDATGDDANAVTTFWPGLDSFAFLAIHPASGPNLGGTGTAVLDGVLDPVEYADAGCLPFDANLPDGTTTPAQLCVMNDATDLHVALHYTPGPAGSLDDLVVLLDRDADGVAGSHGDDMWQFQPWPLVPSGFTDWSWSRDPALCPVGVACSAEDPLWGGTLDGAGVWHRDPADAYALFEISHPLASGDALDVGLVAGGSIGMAVRLRITDGAGNAGSTDVGYPLLVRVLVK